MLRRAAVMSLVVFGCTPSAATTPPAEAAPEAAPVVRETVAPQQPPPAPACDYPVEAPLQLPALVAPEGAGCHKAPAKIEREVRAELRKGWSLTPGARLEIRAGCDRLDPRIDGLVLESSGGHGGSLTIAGFERREDGDFDLVLLDYNHYQRQWPKDDKDPYLGDVAGPLVVSVGRVPEQRMTPLLARLRVASHLEAIEHEPPPRPGVMYGASMSSHDYHVALRLIDHQGRGVQRYFAGYERSGEQQKDSVPMAIVQRVTSELLTDDAFRATLKVVEPDDDDARAVFARVFWQASARGDDFGYWYVGERFLGMAAWLGSPQLMPALLAQLRPPRPEDEERVSRARRTVLALGAIAKITGYDQRYRDGAPRKVDEVAAQTLAACAKQ